jgi:aryl-alcohol dehydrogenase-like predicted oxidoreductase
MPLTPVVRLGKTNLIVPQLGFGALPIQRTSPDEAVRILRRAFEAGVRFFDTARAYSNSEEKLGLALADVRSQIIIATKTAATTAATAREHLETSLTKLKTDYVDLIQLHNPDGLPTVGDADSAYAALVEARRQGLVRHIGITCHKRSVAVAAAASGLFETIQFPLSHISTPEDLALVEECRRHDVGLIAMKALCGGLITNARAAFAFFRTLDNVVPIWGIQHMSELEQFLALQQQPPALDAELARSIDKDRSELAGSFCRGCGYCLPCPADIPIHWAARMSLLLRRAPAQQFLTPDWREKMNRIDTCTNCQQCTTRCPYGLDTPALLKTVLADYRQFANDNGQ